MVTRMQLAELKHTDDPLKRISGGLVTTGELITHKIPLSRIDHAFQLRNTHAPDVIHVMVNGEE